MTKFQRVPESTVLTLPQRKVQRIGCVRYLNAKPLIEGLAGPYASAVTLDVPSRLLAHLQSGRVDLALCPVIDYHRSDVPLEIVPVGGIGCMGPTLTVRLFSRVPMADVTQVHVDVESHTSVALWRVVWSKRYGRSPQIVAYDSGLCSPAKLSQQADCQAMLLIGDKVVTCPPPRDVFRYELDLGEAWYELYQQPFVFAIWMTRSGTALRDWPKVLADQLAVNLTRLDQIADRYAGELGWPTALARDYLSRLMRYPIGGDQWQAIERFGRSAHQLGVIDRCRPLRAWSEAPKSPSPVSS